MSFSKESTVISFGDGSPALALNELPSEEIDVELPKWPLEENMYIKVFKDAMTTVLEHESFLFSESEKIYLRELESLPRPPIKKWISRDTPIDLTLDSDDEDEPQAAEEKPNEGQKNDPRSDTTDDSLFTFHASCHEFADLSELLQLLLKDELDKLAKSFKLKIQGQKKRGDLVAALLKQTSSQGIISYFQPKPLQQANGLKTKYPKGSIGNRLRELAMKSLGKCIKINERVIALIRRLNLVYFRTTAFEEKLLVPAILVASKKRQYAPYETKRSSNIFPSRDALLEYEAALALERKVEDLTACYSNSRSSEMEKQETEIWLIRAYNEVMGLFEGAVERVYRERTGLERFEAGYVYVRTLHHLATIVGQLDEVDTEIRILEKLLAQDRWLLGKRGSWYDRLACIFMKKPTTQTGLEKAYGIITTALIDDTDQSLSAALHAWNGNSKSKRIRRTLVIPLFRNARSAYITGECVRPEEPEVDNPFGLVRPQLKKRSSGRTAWLGRDEVPTTVEDFAIQYYEGKGFKGLHCEGSIVRFIFALLFHDILFMPVNGAFETPYQTGPLDLALDVFYSARKEAIDARLNQILNGDALNIATFIDEENREKQTFYVGSRWDKFKREEILEIIECLEPSVLHSICLQQVHDFEGSGGGVPDLIIWNYKKRDARFVEIWIDTLLSAGAQVELCHVEELQDKKRRITKKEEKNEKARTRRQSKSLSRASSVAASVASRRSQSVQDTSTQAGSSRGTSVASAIVIESEEEDEPMVEEAADELYDEMEPSDDEQPVAKKHGKRLLEVTEDVHAQQTKRQKR
ncbi:Fanconi-associated nuclease 1 homolog {ECO:0000305} {ECO:0000250/UniProtKB:Q9Y2M0} [Serendipita indica DSM 11827]|nr:Fanconi-associated nuclease 1 homolog {ECO:0000305} {ECO:0000250/UniProtKB:Q9Y2M0} [Serendipita indica DSM 11827]